MIKTYPPGKFDQTVEVAFRLGVDPRKADQMVRGTVNLPNGTGKTSRCWCSPPPVTRPRPGEGAGCRLRQR